jgi:tetratricopeptide (TPR) repeat protein
MARHRLSGKNRYLSFIVIGLVNAATCWANEPSVFYGLGNQQLEFREAYESKTRAPDVVQMIDQDQRKYWVKPEAAIASGDVEGLRVSKIKSPYAKSMLYRIEVLMKPASWDKVRSATERLVNTNLAIIRNGQLLYAPMLRTPLDKEISFDGFADEASLNGFTKGFTPTKEPPSAEREKEYTSWLERRSAIRPQDVGALTTLAHESLMKKDYAKALGVFLEIVKRDPSKSEHYVEIGICQSELGQHNQALESWNKALAAPKADHAFVRSLLASSYQALGKRDEAVAELRKSIDLYQKSNNPQKTLIIAEMERRMAELQNPK